MEEKARVKQSIQNALGIKPNAKPKNQEVVKKKVSKPKKTKVTPEQESFSIEDIAKKEVKQESPKQV